jgi:enamine deaminase RidA (YjgF/YER057c/UK114 family)
VAPASFPWLDVSRYSFSLGVRSRDTVYLSGHSGSFYDQSLGRVTVGPDMAAQAKTAWDKVTTLLEAEGLGPEDVVRVVEYVTTDGLAAYADAQSARRSALGAATPAVNVVAVRSLLRPKALLEVEVVASRGGPAAEVDGVIHLPSILPVDDAGAIVGAGDVVAQAHRVFENAIAALHALGLDAGHIVKTVDYSTPETVRQYKHTGAARRDHLRPPYPGAAGILMDRLSHPDALFQLDLTASRHRPEGVNPGWQRYDKLTYLPAVRAGNVLFMSGQAALDPVTEIALHAGDVVAQADYTYRNILAVLEAAGAGPDNLVQTVEYVTPAGLPRYREVADVRRELLREPWPASTGIVCAGLLRREFEIEVDPMAVLDA